MKLALAAFLLAGSVASAERLPSDAVKVVDGKYVLCLVPDDIGRVAYRPQDVRVERNGSDISVKFDLHGLKCARTGSGLALLPRRLNDSFLTKSYDGEVIVNEIVQSEAVLVNHNYTVADRKILDNEEVQAVELTAPVSTMLLPEELERFEAGEEVTFRMEYFNIVTTRYIYDGQSHPGGARAWGSYYFDITLRK